MRLCHDHLCAAGLTMQPHLHNVVHTYMDSEGLDTNLRGIREF